jgi:hypothetical protein
MRAKFGEQFGSKVSISDLEKKVKKTSTEISEIRSTFDTRLTSIQSSVDQLSTKINTQYAEFNTTVQSLVETIAKQNFIIAGIQQEFKISIETISKTLAPIGSSEKIPSTTSATRRLLADK